MLFLSPLVPKLTDKQRKVTLKIYINCSTRVLWFQKCIFLFEESSPDWFYRPFWQWQTEETRNKGTLGTLFVNIRTATAHQTEGPTYSASSVAVPSVLQPKTQRKHPKILCFFSDLLQLQLHCFITTATILEEKLPKRNGIKHYILIDYSRQTRDQITAQKYCANPHPNNTYCEPRCSTTLIRKLLNTVAQKREKFH